MSIASIPSSWEPILTEEFEQPYFEKLQDFLTKSRQTETIFPAEADVFSAFELTAYEKYRCEHRCFYINKIAEIY
jgi:uracil-DNA glycosylase